MSRISLSDLRKETRGDHYAPDRSAYRCRLSGHVRVLYDTVMEPSPYPDADDVPDNAEDAQRIVGGMQDAASDALRFLCRLVAESRSARFKAMK